MILITSGTRFLARHIIAALEKTGPRIRLISREPSDHRDPAKGKCSRSKTDVRDALSLQRA